MNLVVNSSNMAYGSSVRASAANSDLYTYKKIIFGHHIFISLSFLTLIYLFLNKYLSTFSFMPLFCWLSMAHLQSSTRYPSMIDLNILRKIWNPNKTKVYWEQFEISYNPINEITHETIFDGYYLNIQLYILNEI